MTRLNEQVGIVPDTWSGLPVGDFGPTKEARMARLLEVVWTDPSVKQRLFADASALLREQGIEIPPGLEVVALEDAADEFTFVVPVVPPEAEFAYRYEQIAGWWMFAHQLWYWMGRELDIERARTLREGLLIQLIGRSWNDLAFRQRLIDDPVAALGEEGLYFPEDLKVTSVTNTEDRFYLPLPPPAAEVSWDREGLAGAWFVKGHTLWWWLVAPRLISDDAGTVTGLVG